MRFIIGNMDGKALNLNANELCVLEAIGKCSRGDSAKGLDRGEFTIPGVGSFQLQRTDVFNLADYNKYKGEEAVNWRAKAKEKLRLQNLVKGCTASMAGFLKTFIDLNPDKEPDEIKLTVKVIEN